MSQRKLDPPRLGIAGVHLFLFLLVFWPALDFLSTVWPLRPGNVDWRYGFVGLFAAYLLTPLLGLGLAMVLAYFRQRAVTLRLLSAFCLLSALILLPVMASFALDVVQLRGTRPPQALPSFQAGAIVAELKHFSAFIALSLLGLGGWKGAKELSGRRKEPSRKGRSGDLVGMPQKTPSAAGGPSEGG